MGLPRLGSLRDREPHPAHAALKGADRKTPPARP